MIMKPTRLLVYSFTISFSLFFITLFSIWIFKTTPSLQPQHQTLHFKPFQESFKTVQNQTFIGSTVYTTVLNHTKISKLDKKSRGMFSLANSTKKGEVGNKVKGVFSLVNGTRKGKVGDEVKGLLSLVNNTKKGKVGSEVKGVFGLSGKRSTLSSSKVGVCDVSNGRWVYDERYPLYSNKECPFIDEGFSCEVNGRLDKEYTKWRWEPFDCDIPRFDAVKMLELIRGKRLVFVGDSINRNQWESMLCLLRSAVKDPKRVYETHGRRIRKDIGSYSFKFLDYKCTVEYYASHFLVNEGKTRVKQKRIQTLRIDAIDRSSKRWKGADILVFNTAHWWSHYKTKSGVNYYQEGDQVIPHLHVSTAFKRALTTWASWVDIHATPNKTKVFFRSSAPSHFKGGQWDSGGHCREAIQPLKNTSNVNHPDRNMIADEVIRQMKTHVTFLNITSLSEFRIDGHPSVYGRKPGKETPSRVQDCSHWCLPGVPDTWNELLYFYLYSNQKTNSIDYAIEATY